MKKKLPILFIGLSVIVFFGCPLIGLPAAAAEHHGEEGHHSSEKSHHHGEEGQHHHKAHHGGVLNVIGKCETGHIEIRLEADTLEAWLVGGGHDTDRAVPVKAQEIPLRVSVPGKGEVSLVLKADPMKLAGETVGHCSRFIAKADWLQEVEKFEARGELLFKGIRHKLLIKYPEGHDPEHGHGGH